MGKDLETYTLKMVTDLTERAYLQGERAILVRQLREVYRALGYMDDGEAPLVVGETYNLKRSRASLIIEREEAIASLRSLCSEIGDNLWNEDLHLADIISRHISREKDSKWQELTEWLIEEKKKSMLLYKGNNRDINLGEHTAFGLTIQKIKELIEQ